MWHGCSGALMLKSGWNNEFLFLFCYLFVCFVVVFITDNIHVYCFRVVLIYVLECTYLEKNL